MHLACCPVKQRGGSELRKLSNRRRRSRKDLEHSSQAVARSNDADVAFCHVEEVTATLKARGLRCAGDRHQKRSSPFDGEF